MANEGQFPKVDGDVLFASEINNMVDSFSDVKTYNLAVSDSSSALDLSGDSYKYSILIKNVGSVDCYFDLDSTATTSSMFIEAGASILLKNSTFDDVSAITSANTTTLSVAVFIGVSNETGEKDEFEVLSLSATDSSNNDSFTDTSSYKDILIINEGSSDVYVSFSATATTSDYKLSNKDSISLNTNKYQISTICDSGDTATVKILGVY